MKSFNDVLIELNVDKSANTTRTYGRVYSQYKAFLGKKKPTIENAEKFMITKSKLKPASVHIYRMALRTYFIKNDIEIPKGKLKGIVANNVREDKFVTRKEVDQLHRYADNLRDKVIIRMGYHAGPRPIELINMNVGDLDLHNEKVNIRGVKGSRTIRRVRFIRPELVIPTVRAYLEQRQIDPDNPTDKQKKEPLILNSRNNERIGYMGVYGVVAPMGVCIGKPDMTPHWLRHGFVVWNKVHGVPPEITARQIGDTIKTTMNIYSHYADSDVDRVYDEIQGQTAEEKPKSKNPIDEIEELKVEIKGQDAKIRKLYRGLQILDGILSERGIKREIRDLPPVAASDIEPGEERRLVQEYKELLGTWGE